MVELFSLSLREARDLLRQGEITAGELTSSCLSRIEKTEPNIQALLYRNNVDSLTYAGELDKTRGKSMEGKALWGIPITVKDAFLVKDMPATGASRSLQGFRPAYDAFVIARLKEAGAIIIGKTNMDEFAMGSSTEYSAYQVTKNPWDATRVAGGSSGGSAASVASCQAFVSLGSDSGGSIRQPAALCGCVGFKPTYGRISRYGVMAYASSFDQVGLLTRSVEDVALVLQVIAGHDRRDSTSSQEPVPDYPALMLQAGDSLKGLRLGLPKEFMDDAVMTAGVAQATQNALQAARDLGAEIVEVSLPHTKYAVAAYYILTTAEVSSNMARIDGIRYGMRGRDVNDLEELYVKTRTAGLGAEVQRRILLGTYVLSAGYYDAYYKKAAQARRLIRDDFIRAFAACDMLVAPVTTATAWPINSITDPLQRYQKDVFTLPLNLAGLPGLSIPVGLSDNLPVGMQIMGKAYAEGDILAVGHKLTKILQTDKQRAPL